MSTSLLPTLGAGAGELIIAGLVIFFTVGGWIMNLIKTTRENAKANQQQRQVREEAQRDAMRMGSPSQSSQAASASDLPPQTPQDRLNALAARRRAELDRLRQRSGVPSIRARASTEPDNLSAAQRAARDRAKQAYERRAELLARQRDAQQEAARQNTARVQAAKQAKSQASQARAQPVGQRQEAQAPQAAKAQNAPRAQMAARKAVLGGMALSQADRDIATAAASAARGMTPSKPITVDTLSSDAATSHGLEIHRQEGHVAVPASGLKRALNGKSLRAAFILKEVLDRPVALRDADEERGMLLY